MVDGLCARRNAHSFTRQSSLPQVRQTLGEPDLPLNDRCVLATGPDGAKQKVDHDCPKADTTLLDFSILLNLGTERKWYAYPDAAGYSMRPKSGAWSSGGESVVTIKKNQFVLFHGGLRHAGAEGDGKKVANLAYFARTGNHTGNVGLCAAAP